MVRLRARCLPILVATVLVFVASCIAWMALPHHKSDARRMPDEAAALEALGRQNVRPGLYRFPWADSMAEMKDPAFVAKLDKGPVALMTVLPSGPFNMGKSMALWTGYLVVIGIFVAYITGRVLRPPPSPASSGSPLQNAIWGGKPLSVVFKEIVDGVVYGLLTAGAFGWLWPR